MPELIIPSPRGFYGGGPCGRKNEPSGEGGTNAAGVSSVRQIRFPHPKTTPNEKSWVGRDLPPTACPPLEHLVVVIAAYPSLNKSTPCLNDNKVNDAHPLAFDKA